MGFRICISAQRQMPNKCEGLVIILYIIPIHLLLSLLVYIGGIFFLFVIWHLALFSEVNSCPLCRYFLFLGMGISCLFAPLFRCTLTRFSLVSFIVNTAPPSS